MITYELLPAMILLGISLSLMAKHGELDGFPAGILILLFSMLCSVALGGDLVPIGIGVVGFAILGSLGVFQVVKRMENNLVTSSVSTNKGEKTK